MSEKQSTEFSMAIVALIGVVILVAIVYGVTAARFANVSGSPGTPEQIAARIAPIGSVNIAEAAAGEAVAAAPATGAAAPAAAAAPAEVTTSAAGEGSGQTIYSQACFACHATGAAGAPLLGDAAAWGPRIAKGMDELMYTVLNGKGAMPPRGTCATCSDEDLKAAVQYMISQIE